jgi:hypothetical protein
VTPRVRVCCLQKVAAVFDQNIQTVWIVYRLCVEKQGSSQINRGYARELGAIDSKPPREFSFFTLPSADLELETSRGPPITPGLPGS